MSLTEQEAVECFDAIVNCQRAHRAICQHFLNPPSTVEERKTRTGHITYGVTLASMVKLAVCFAKSDWDTNFSGKEPQPTWRRHDVSTYLEQIVDLCMENKERFL